MYDIFKLFLYSTRLEVFKAYTFDPLNRDFVNPVEACMKVEHNEIYRATRDLRDIGRLAKNLYAKHSKHTPDDSFKYAQTYDDYTEFLNDWEQGTVDVKKAMGLDVAEKLLEQATEDVVGRLTLIAALDTAIFETFVEQRLEMGAGIYTINLLFKQLEEVDTGGED